jgi:ribosome maturation factor RimP
MPPADVIEAVRAIAARIAKDRGLEIFDVQFRREGSGMVLRVQLDRPGPASTAEESVGVDDCVEVSRDLSAVLDVEDVVPVAYTLEVSSPGLDRPLRGADDYRRFAGRFAKIVLRSPIDGQG